MDDIVPSLAKSVGASDIAIRFLLSLLAGYPLGFLYRLFIHGSPEVVQHIFFTATGISLMYFNFGLEAIHSLVNILVIYAVLVVARGTKFSVAFAFVFNTIYLILGYIQFSYSAEYTISWATPHCVVTLRLTALVFDIYDGKKKEEQLSQDQKATCLRDIPSLLSICGQTYYFGAVLAGPQFSMRRYLAFTRGEFTAHIAKDALQQKSVGPPASIGPALTRFALGIVYIIIHQGGQLIFYNSYFFEEDYQSHGLISKCLYILVWGRILLCKYIGTWLLAEGVCILTGISYNGKDVNGNILWDGINNVRLYDLEVASTFQQLIESFNRGTNKWMLCYIYKRLRFLGNKVLSQSVTLFYLALWHGIFSGYYMNFFLEFIMVNSENQAMALVQRVPVLQQISTSPVIKPVVWILRKLLVTFSLSYALVSFGFLAFDKYMKIYSSVFFIAHVIFLGYPFLDFILKKLLVTSKAKENNSKTTKFKDE